MTTIDRVITIAHPELCSGELESPITKTRLFKYIENFTTKKEGNFQIKTSDIFIFLLKTQTVGPGGSNEYPQSMF